MITQLRSEAYKLLTTRTNIGVLAGMVALIAAAILLHAFGLPIDKLGTQSEQRGILIDVGANLGALFAGLLGALAITSEFRTGTIRPTLLANPNRGKVIAAKALCVLGAGAITGLLAAGTAASVGSIGLATRGVTLHTSGTDIVRLLSGAVAGGALWAAIGLGVGAVIRAQVPAVVGLCAWLLFVENVLAGDLPNAHKYVPGALAQSLAGSTRDGVLSSPPLAAALLIAYAAALAVAGSVATGRRDVA